MHEHWEHKKRRSGGMSNPQIDEWYELGAEERRPRRQAGRRRRRRLPDVLRRGSPPPAARDGEGRARGGALPLRLRGHEGPAGVSLPVAILAGGLATRLRPLTETIPKALVEVAGRPFAVHQLELLAGAGHHRRRVAGGLPAANQIARGARRRQRAGACGSPTCSTAPRCSAPAARCARALPHAGRGVLRAVRRLVPGVRLRRRRARVPAERALRPDDRLPQRRTAGTRSNVEFADGRIVALRQDGPHAARCATSTTGLGVLTAGAFAPYPDGEPLDLAPRLSGPAGRRRSGGLRGDQPLLRNRLARGPRRHATRTCGAERRTS